MEKQLLALSYENYSNYIKLPQSILSEFNQYIDNDVEISKPKKRKQIKSKNIKINDKIKIEPPYYFSIESSNNVITYCGVLDFTADDGLVMIPINILNQLGIDGSDIVTVKYINNIPKGDFTQLEPLNKEIFSIPHLDEYLEMVLSNYCLLYKNQIIEFKYANSIYRILIKDIKTNMDLEMESNNLIWIIPIIDIVNIDLKIDIYNKFLEEEIKEKQLLKNKEQENIEKGNKLGGIIINDPILLREIRVKKMMESINKCTIDKKIEQIDNSMNKLFIKDSSNNLSIQINKKKEIIL